MNPKTGLISVGTDRKVFDQRQSVAKRQMDYAESLSKNIYLIVFSLKKHKCQYTQLADKVFIYPTNSRNRFMYIVDAFILIRKIIKKEKIDLLTSQDPFETGLTVYLGAFFYRLPFHLQIHTDMFSSYFKKGLLNRVRLLIACYIIPRCYGLRVVSSRIADSLHNNFSNLPPVSVLPIFINSFNNYKFKQNDDINKKPFPVTILWLGRFESEKNPLLAIQVLKNIRQTNVDVGLVLIGSGSLEPALLKSIQKFNLESWVEIKPWQDQVAPWFRVSDLYLLTSWYEGYGLTLVEASLNKTPIVTTDVGLVGSVLKSDIDIMVCPPGDVECLTKKSLTVLKDLSLSSRLKVSGYKTTEEALISYEKYLLEYVFSLKKAIMYKK